MKKAFGYVRVSGKGQVSQDGPDRQRAAIIAFAAQHGLEIVGIHKDLAVSGTTGHEEREGFQRMMLDAIDQGVDIVIVEKMDRLARDLMVSEFMIRDLAARKMTLYSVEAGLQDMVTSAESDPGRTFIRQIFAAAAQLDKSSLVLKLRAARKRIRDLEGKCEGIKPLEELPGGVTTLNLITSMRNQCMSWQTIKIHLNFAEIRKPNGKEWKSEQEVAAAYRRFTKRYKRNEERKRNGLVLQSSTGQSEK